MKIFFRKNYKWLVLIVIVLVILGIGIMLFLNHSNTLAQEMRLEKYMGEITLQNSDQVKEVVEGSRLVSQDNIETFEESNAYISLDNEKALKVDQVSHIEVIKVDNQLDIEVYKGSIYFDVSKPLMEEESLDFYTNNIVTGVRGTSGVILYLEDVSQSQVLVLSGTVEVVTIEKQPQVAMVSQGEVAFATTLKDGTVLLEIRAQEETPFYPFSSDFLDDTGSDIEAYAPLNMVREDLDAQENFEDVQADSDEFQEMEGDIALDWKEVYAQHLGESESYYDGYSGLELIGNFTAVDAPSHAVDLSATTYWLHDMDLDGIPELFLKFHYAQYASKFYIFTLFGEDFESKDLSDGLQYKWLTGVNYSDLYLAIPTNGIGIYQQYEMASREEREFFGDKGTLCIITKGQDNLNWWDGTYGDVLEGTFIDTTAWAHYTDLSGLEWN